jgi:hypothetical protein
MIEAYADGTYKCFKCKKKRPVESFMYNDKLGRHGHFNSLQDEINDYVEHGHAWACEDCFLKSGFFCKLQEGEDVPSKPSDRWPDVRYEDLTKCIHCQMYWPFWDYSSYNKWRFDGQGNRMDVIDPSPLHTFIKETRMVWGCSRCYTESGLKAHLKEGDIRWRAYKPKGEFSWAEMAKRYKLHGDYQAID